MSPNGSLVAYSTPADMLQLRDQAALISMAWRGDSETISNGFARPSSSDSGLGRTRALTVEFGSYNLIARAIQPDLILILLGGVFPGKRDSFELTKENLDDPVYPLENSNQDGKAKNSSTLQLQRRKADKLARFIESEAKHLAMSEDTLLSKPFS